MSDVQQVEKEEDPGLRSAGPTTFATFPISQEVRDAIAGLGYETPTEVQSAVIEAAVGGRDLVVQAKTGSGKTSAFGIPISERTAGGTAAPGEPLALVLVPTRELALQVATELRGVGVHKGLRCQAIYGGVSMGRQTAALESGVEVIVGTPGRLLDHVRRKNLSLSSLQTVVLDEADEMLSMGFWDDVTDILKMTPDGRQTMLFSATLPYQVAHAAAQFLKDPARIDVSGDILTVEGIENAIYHVKPDIPKPRQLLYVLECEAPASAIIFCNTRNETEMIAKYLTQSGLIAKALTGNFRQKERERVMARIKSGSLRFMVATDVAARGIDIEDLSHVLQYSLPEYSEVYLHRVGRTGRVGKVGSAISLVDGKGLGTLSVLEREFNLDFVEKHLPPEEDVLRRRSQRIMKELSEQASVAEVGLHMPTAQEILDGEDAPQVVAFLLKSYFNTRAATDDKRGSSRPAKVAEVDAANDQPTEGRRRRRRRRRRRGRSGENSQAGNPIDIVDAGEILAGGNGAGPSTGQEGGTGGGNGASPDGDALTRLRVNIGFDDGFKGRGAVAKKIAALAGLNDGIVNEVESKREYAVIAATPEIAELVIERVDGAQLGKKIITVAVAS